MMPFATHSLKTCDRVAAMNPAPHDQWQKVIADARREATEDDTPIVDFVLNTIWYVVPVVIISVIFLAALRILGLF